jgi:two-component system, cell cycle response regulator
MAKTSPSTDEMTRQFTPPSAEYLPEVPSLILIYGDQLGRRFPISGQLAIGRGASNDIVLEVGDVSRRHAVLRPQDGAIVVADAGSTNGTELNGSRISGEVELSNGDLLNIGGVIFKYIAGGNVEALFHEEIYRMTVLDGLTQLHNRRSLWEFLDREIARAHRHERPLSFLLFDIDHFKRINDSHGHLAGDRVIERVASIISRSSREEDLAARYGGEEFALVLPEMTAEEAVQLADGIRLHVEAESFEVGGITHRVTISGGLSSLRREQSREELVSIADAQLYQAKLRGRNRICMA